MNAVAQLYASLDDPYPGPSKAQQVTQGGQSPSNRVPCGTCNKTGKIKRTYPWTIPPDGQVGAMPPTRVCPMCDGYGWRKRKPKDPYYDEYTGERISSGGEKQSRPRTMTLEEIDHELDKLRQDKLRRHGILTHEMYAWERRIKEREKHGSYTELLRVLRLMREKHPVLYKKLREDDPSALEWVATRMRGRIRVPKWVRK